MTTHLLKFLQEKTKIFIWIATRPERKEELEKAHGHLAISLIPFSEQDQRQFLVGFWKTVYENKSELDDVQRNEFAHKCI